MKNKTIYILRHGETDYNKKGMVQGRGVNASLNAQGRTQARQAGEAFKDVPFDHVYTSALVRTQETVGEFIPKDMPITSFEGFDEISWGNQEGVVADYEAKNLYAQTVNSWRQGHLELNVGGGENPLQVMHRQKNAMQQVMQNPGEQILICMHGRALRILLCWTLNYPLQYMDGFPHQNCSYYVLEHRLQTFSLRQFNQIGHLQ